MNSSIIVISSKQLKRDLSLIDFSFDFVVNATISKNGVSLETDFLPLPIQIDCVTNVKEEVKINQSDFNWKWVYQAVRSLPEQPITLEISERYLRMVLNFKS